MFFSASWLSGQCDYTADLEIEDQSSFTIDFLVSGAENNILGVDNCVEIVTTHFYHQFVSDVTIELESPSGDIVPLVGAESDGNSTDLVNAWNVNFVNRDSLMAMPDLDYDDVWNSNPVGGWVIFQTYTGSYYPYQSGLENFTGSVNGVWKLHVSDESLFGSGTFSCFGMEFCNDDDNITVATCSPISHTLTESDYAFCEGSDDLNMTIVPDFDSEYDSAAYDYKYLLFDDSGFQELTTSTDFTSSVPGTYTICGIHYFLDDTNEVEAISTGIDLEGIQTYLIDNEVCATISDDCIEIEVYNIPDIITEQITLCIGDTVTIGEDKYFESGIYEVFNSVSPCDSISFLDLTIYDIDVNISSSNDEISCDVNTIELNAEGTITPPGASFSWTTTDGQFATNASNKIVQVSSAGTYVFEVVISGCLFSDEIIITENDDFVIFDVTAGDITCLLDSAYVDLVSSDSIVNVLWTGAGTFTTIGEDIQTNTPGLYTVEFETEFGCVVTQEIEVEDVREYPIFDLVGDTITCQMPTITLATANTDLWNSSFFWFKDNEQLGTGSTLNVNQPGQYELRVQTQEGCLDSFNIDVVSVKDTIEVELFSGEIGCVQKEVIISYASNFGGLTTLWTLPNNDPVIDTTFVSDQPGTYNLFLEDENGCTLDTSLVVIENLDTPDILVDEISFLCGQDSVQVTSSVDMTDVTYHWTSINGFSDTSAVPWVFAPGEYIVEACLQNGCCDIDTFLIGVDNDLPVVSFEFSDINCDSDTTYIVPSDTSSYTMSWFFNGTPLTVDSNIIMVVDTGLYEVMVTNPANGCSSNYSFDIKEDKVSTIDELSANIINCERTEVQINVEADRVFESYTWNGPGVLDTQLEPFVNHESNSINILWEGPNFTGEGESVTISEPGIYNVYAVAPGQCRDTIQINVAADTISPVLAISNDGIITCTDTIIDITLVVDQNTTSYTFSGPGIISQDETVIEVDKPGIYSATGMADNGCTTTITNEVLISNEFPDYVINLDSFTCVQDEVIVGFTSSDFALSVIWDGPIDINDGTYNFATNEAGSYAFTLTNDDGCRIQDSFYVLRDTFPPTGSIDLSNQITCIDESVTLSINDFDSYWDVTWTGSGVSDPNAQTVITTEVGEYTLELVGENGCIQMDTAEVLYDTLSAVIEVQGKPITCTAAKVFLNVASDIILIDYTWEGPNNYQSSDIEPLIVEEGNYQVTVTSVNGCIATGQIEIIDERVFPAIEINDYYLPCDGQPAVVFPSDISQGSSARWFGPNNYFVDEDTALIFSPGEYVGIAVTEEGCSAVNTFQVIDEATPPLFSLDADTLLCFGPVEIRGIDTGDDRSVLWEGPNGFEATTATTLAGFPGIYTMTVIGENGCTDNQEIELIDGRVYPMAKVSNEEQFQCQITEIDLTGAGSSEGPQFFYKWSTEDGIILGNSNSLNTRIEGVGTYVLEVKDASIGCISYDTLVLDFEEQDFKGVELLISSPTCLG